jgi:hypothetical protein
MSSGTAFEYEKEGDTIAVWGVNLRCGRRFDHVAIIHDPESSNPTVEIPKPLGVNGTLKLCNEIKEGLHLHVLSGDS